MGKKTGKNPTDRSKLGVKRSVLVDGRGVPLGAAVDGANVHDQKLVESTLDDIPVERPTPTPHKPQHLCLDKGYVGAPVKRVVRRRGYQVHVPAKGKLRPCFNPFSLSLSLPTLLSGVSGIPGL